MVADAVVVCCVTVKVVRLGQSLKMVYRVGTQHLGLGCLFRLDPVNFEIALRLQLFNRSIDPEWSLRVPGTVVGCAAFVCYNGHFSGTEFQLMSL